MSNLKGKWTTENFKKYHEENPSVYSLFERFSLEMASKKKNFSAKCIFHRIRWETAVTNTTVDYKIDDGWISHYARMFVEKHPKYKDFFEFRTRKNSYHT
tara:strand:- start:113 stop:412 length:300 start_codon:yes stop_codon:yes gene_type:complete